MAVGKTQLARDFIIMFIKVPPVARIRKLMVCRKNEVSEAVIVTRQAAR
jgi:hypothetical protein